MSVSLAPDFSGDVVLAVESSADGNSIDIRIVDSTGAPKSPGLDKPAAFVYDGGIVHLETFITQADLGIVTDPADQHPLVTKR